MDPDDMADPSELPQVGMKWCEWCECWEPEVDFEFSPYAGQRVCADCAAEANGCRL